MHRLGGQVPSPATHGIISPTTQLRQYSQCHVAWPPAAPDRQHLPPPLLHSPPPPPMAEARQGGALLYHLGAAYDGVKGSGLSGWGALGEGLSDSPVMGWTAGTPPLTFFSTTQTPAKL